MRLELYTIPKCDHAEKIRSFLQENNLPFKEIIVDNQQIREKIRKLSWQDTISILKITKNHSIHIINGFNKFNLNQLLDHIKKYNPKIE